MGYEKIVNVACGILLMATGPAFASDPPPEGGGGSVAVRLYLIDGAIPADDPNAAAWERDPARGIQTGLPRFIGRTAFQEVTVKSVKVRGMHNGQDMAIMLEYDDPSDDAADAAAIEFMVGEKMAHFRPWAGNAAGRRGTGQTSGTGKTEQGKAVDMSAKGFKTIRPQEQQDVSATGAWQDGTWRVVFSRPLRTGDEHDVQVTPGKWKNVAFAFWDGEIVDGAVKEKGSQKAVSSWWYLRAEPQPDNSIYGYVVLGIVLAAGFEFFLLRRIRRGNES